MYYFCSKDVCSIQCTQAAIHTGSVANVVTFHVCAIVSWGLVEKLLKIVVVSAHSI